MVARNRRPHGGPARRSGGAVREGVPVSHKDYEAMARAGDVPTPRSESDEIVPMAACNLLRMARLAPAR